MYLFSASEVGGLLEMIKPVFSNMHLHVEITSVTVLGYI